MVRRLKSDIRDLEGGFPKRKVIQIDIDGLPNDAPELVLASKLDAYRIERDKRLLGETQFQQTTAALVIGGLQKRLLSSIEAFARTLAVHRRSVEHALKEAAPAEEVSQSVIADLERLTLDVDSGDTLSEIPDDDSELDTGDFSTDSEEQPDLSSLELDGRMEKATAASSDATQAEKRSQLAREMELIDEMRDTAEASRYVPDPRIGKFIEWISENMCPSLLAGRETSPKWNDRRVIVFTEYEDTRRYLERCLTEAISNTDMADERIATFTGSTPRQRREDIKRAFNTEPDDHPLRILIATGCRKRGIESSAPLPRSLPLRPTMESRKARSAERPNRPQVATGRGGGLPLFRI